MFKKSLSIIGVTTFIILLNFTSFATTNKQATSLSSLLSSHNLAIKNQNRVALVIGNSRYQKVGSLSNPTNDADDIAKALQALGFDVIKVLNADKKQMDAALETFRLKLDKGGIGVFYYAGHGVQVEGENYLIPIDAQLNSEKDVNYEALPVGKIQNLMEAVGTETNVIILDACRNNPFSRKWNRSTLVRGLAPIQAISGSYIAFATSPGLVAADGENRNGTFTFYILKFIKTPNLRIENLFKQVRQNVTKVTNKAQIPWDSSSLINEFSFNPVVTADTSTPPPASTSKPEPSPRQSTNPTLDVKSKLIGTWKASAVEFGQSFEIILRIKPEGTADYSFKNSNGKIINISSIWQYSDGVITERTPDGTVSKAAIEFINSNYFVLTILTNSAPGSAGFKRHYYRDSP